MKIKIIESPGPLYETTQRTHICSYINVGGDMYANCGTKLSLETTYPVRIPNKEPCTKCFPKGSRYEAPVLSVVIE